MFDKIIFHVDVNSAFLSWEAVHRITHLKGTTDLREIPSAIGGDISQRHGIILAKSIPARKYGVRTGEAIPEALQKCPGLFLAPPNYGLYERSSRAFLNILREYSPCVEPFSIDEAYMDMSETCSLFGTPEEAARIIRRRIHETLGFTINIGVSSNKLLAKMASDFQKPNRVHLLFPQDIPRKLWPLPVSSLFFAGRASSGKLLNLGIRTIGDLAHADPDLIRTHLKKHGELLQAFANGIDLSPVAAVPAPNKGYGNSTTVPFDITRPADASLVLLGLSETVSARLRADRVKAQVLSVSIKYSDFSGHSHQCVLDEATDITIELARTAFRLFQESWNGHPIRHLGVHVNRISREAPARQLELFPSVDYEKLERMDRTVDSIRRRFGNDSIKRAAFLNTPIDHRSGGISRERRSVDYEQLNLK